MKSWIVMFFGMLSIGHPDAFTTLVESLALIPSVIEMNCERHRPNSGSPPLSMLSYRRSWSLTVP